MSEQWLDYYYLFSIKFWWVLYKWHPFWHPFKALGGFRKAVWEAVEMKIYVCKIWGCFINLSLWVVLRINFDKVLRWLNKSGSPIVIPSKLEGLSTKPERWFDQILFSQSWRESLWNYLSDGSLITYYIGWHIWYTAPLHHNFM
jgi:hypothetical protein